MVKYFDIEFNDFSFQGILNTLEDNGVETDLCLAFDDYDKNTKLLFDTLTAEKIVECETEALCKVIKTLMVLENGGFDVLEWYVTGAWRNENYHQTFNQEYIYPRNKILEHSKDFKGKNMVAADNLNPKKIKYT